MRLIHGDCLEVLPGLEMADALITDPPAGIGFMGAEWDSHKGGRAQWVAWLAERMAAARRVLRPGAVGLVWALPRTSHWTATALEDAGFVIEDRVSHIFGSGFPKHKSKLKPAVEDWWLVRNPGPKWLGVEACRVGYEDNDARLDWIEKYSGRNYGEVRNEIYGARTSQVGGTAAGRWPPHLVLSHASDCNGVCAEGCPVRVLGEQSGEKPASWRRAQPDRAYADSIFPQPAKDRDARGHADTGTAARFFPQFDAPQLCWLCGLHDASKRGIMSETQAYAGGSLWHDANTAAVSSEQSGAGSGIARDLAAAQQRLFDGGSSHHENSPASTAGEPLWSMPATIEAIVHEIARDTPTSRIALAVRSVASLCVRCAIVTARSLVVIKRGDPVSTRGLGFIPEHSAQTLLRSLAPLAEAMENTDTTPTIASLKLWCGYAQHAINSFITPEPNEGLSPAQPFLYQSKASRRERNAGCEGMEVRAEHRYNGGEGFSGRTNVDGEWRNTDAPRVPTANVHPTVKSQALMRWLVRLACPPGGVVLDPFMGSGSTGCAAVAEGMGFVGIEQDAEYFAIAEARLAHATQQTRMAV